MTQAGRVYKVPPTEQTQLNTIIAGYTTQAAKDKFQFLYEQLAHSGMLRSKAMLIAQRQTQD